MSVSIGIHLVTLNEKHEKTQEYITQAGSDDLALMFLDWRANCPIGFSNVLSDEEIGTICSTYGEESMSVADDLSEFKPNIRKASEIVKVLNKIRNRVLFPKVKSELSNPQSSAYLSEQLIPALMAISECIAILSLSTGEHETVFIALNDY